MTAFAVTGGVKGAQLATTTTDANGRYTLTGLPPGALVLLEVSPNAQGTTTMLDEATDVAVTLPADSTFKLRAAINLEESGATSAQITAFTEMAVALAVNEGGQAGLTADVVTAANSTVSSFAGVSILTAAPTFDTSGAATNAAAVKLAAISELAKAGVGSCAAPQANPTASDVLASVSCVTAYLASQGTSEAAATALNNVLGAAIADASLSGSEQAEAERPVQKAIYVETGTKTGIQEAKDLIASVRATGAALADKADATSLAKRIQDMEEASYGVVQPLDEATITLLTAVNEAIGAHQDGATGAFALKGRSYFDNGDGQLGSGCTYFVADDFVTPSESRTDYLGCRVFQEWKPAYEGQNWQPVAVYHRMGLTENADGSFTVTTRLAHAPILNAQAGQPAFGTEEALSQRRSLTATVGDALALTGELAPGYDLRGSGTPEVSPRGTHQEVAITLSETTSQAVRRYALHGEVAVYEDEAPESRFSLKEGSYVEEPNVNGPVEPSKAHFVLEAQLRDGFKFGGTVDLTEFDETGPENGTLVGYLTDMTGARLFDGTLTLAMPTDNRANWDVKLDGTLVTTGTNTLTINLTAKQPAPGDLTVTGRYTQGTTTFLLTVVQSDATPANDRLTVTTTAGGVGFVVKPEDTLVPIKKGDTVLGRFNVDDGRLTYTDGSYEQF